MALLVLSAMYLLLTLPKLFLTVLRYLVDKYNLIEYSMQVDAQMLLASAICAILEYSFLSFKFVIYFTTSHQFRLEFFKLFPRCVGHSWFKAIACLQSASDKGFIYYQYIKQ